MTKQLYQVTHKIPHGRIRFISDNAFVYKNEAQEYVDRLNKSTSFDYDAKVVNSRPKTYKFIIENGNKHKNTWKSK